MNVTEHILYADEEKRFQAEEDNDNLQRMLNRLPDVTVRNFVNPKQHPESFLSSLGRVLHKDGFYFCTLAPFVKELRDTHSPVRGATMPTMITKNGEEYPITYWVVLTKREDETLKIVNSSPELQRFKVNPVQLVFGEWTGKFPTTNDLRWGESYQPVWPVIQEVTGLKPPPGTLSEIKTKDLLTGSSVPIFTERNRRGYFFQEEKRAELEGFLGERFRQIKAGARL